MEESMSLASEGKEIIHFNTTDPSINYNEWCPKWMCITSPNCHVTGSAGKGDNGDRVTLAEFARENGYDLDLMREALDLSELKTESQTKRKIRYYNYDDIVEMLDDTEVPYKYVNINMFASAIGLSVTYARLAVDTLTQAKVHRYRGMIFVDPAIESDIMHAVAEVRESRKTIVKKQLEEYRAKRQERYLNIPGGIPDFRSKQRVPARPTFLTQAKAMGYYAVTEASEYTGIPKSTFQAYSNEGIIKPVEIALKHGMRFYTKESLDELRGKLEGFDMKGAAEYLGCGRTTIRRYIVNGRLPCVQLTSAVARIKKEDLDRIKKEWRGIKLEDALEVT
jgi:excisionase family DNA binding protein